MAPFGGGPARPGTSKEDGRRGTRPRGWQLASSSRRCCGSMSSTSFGVRAKSAASKASTARSQPPNLARSWDLPSCRHHSPINGDMDCWGGWTDGGVDVGRVRCVKLSWWCSLVWGHRPGPQPAPGWLRVPVWQGVPAAVDSRTDRKKKASPHPQCIQVPAIEGSLRDGIVTPRHCPPSAVQGLPRQPCSQGQVNRHCPLRCQAVSWRQARHHLEQAGSRYVGAGWQGAGGRGPSSCRRRRPGCQLGEQELHHGCD